MRALIKDDEKTYYLVTALKTEHPVEVQIHGINGERKLPLVWADGMIGVLPVFDSFSAAQDYIRLTKTDGAQILVIKETN